MSTDYTGALTNPDDDTSVTNPRGASSTPPWPGTAIHAAHSGTTTRAAPQRLWGLLIGCLVVVALLVSAAILRPDQYLFGGGTIQPIAVAMESTSAPTATSPAATATLPAPTVVPTRPPTATPLPPTRTIRPTATMSPSPMPVATGTIATSMGEDLPLPDTAEGDSFPWILLVVAVGSAMSGLLLLALWRRQRGTARWRWR